MNEECDQTTPSPGQPVAPIPVEPIPRQTQLEYQIRPAVYRTALILFGATCLSTFSAGMFPGSMGMDLDFWLGVLVGAARPTADQWRELLLNGATYSAALMGILVCHEMGHYLQSLRYRVPATPPLFIPMPFVSPFGTMGAIILQAPGKGDRKAIFDIAVSGPLAGLLMTLPILYLGLKDAKTAVFDPAHRSIVYGDPLILKWLATAINGPLPPNTDYTLNPLLFAGWIGLLITSLNLVPIGQLDGGHLAYCLLGKRRSHLLSRVAVVLAIFYMWWTGEWTFLAFIMLILISGTKHPPTANDEAPIGVARYIIGWLTLAFLLVGFSPQPVKIIEPEVPAAQKTDLLPL